MGCASRLLNGEVGALHGCRIIVTNYVRGAVVGTGDVATNAQILENTNVPVQKAMLTRPGGLLSPTSDAPKSSLTRRSTTWAGDAALVWSPTSTSKPSTLSAPSASPLPSFAGVVSFCWASLNGCLNPAPPSLHGDYMAWTTNPYCVLADVKTAMNVTSTTDDAWITDLITEAQADIDRYLCFMFQEDGPGTYRLYDGQDAEQLWIDNASRYHPGLETVYNPYIGANGAYTLGNPQTSTSLPTASSCPTTLSPPAVPPADVVSVSLPIWVAEL